MADKLPKLVLNRDYFKPTLKGHCLSFKKGVPTHVPKEIYKDAMAIGAQPYEGAEVPDLDEAKKGAAPTDPEVRTEKIAAAIKIMVARNERTDFTAAGMPNANTVSKEVGFPVQTKELAPIWALYQEEQAGL